MDKHPPSFRCPYCRLSEQRTAWSFDMVPQPLSAHKLLLTPNLDYPITVKVKSMFSPLPFGPDFQNSLYRKSLFIAAEQHTQDKIYQKLCTVVPEPRYFIPEVHNRLTFTLARLQWHGRLCKYCSCAIPTSEQV